MWVSPSDEIKMETIVNLFWWLLEIASNDLTRKTILDMRRYGWKTDESMENVRRKRSPQVPREWLPCVQNKDEIV